MFTFKSQVRSGLEKVLPFLKLLLLCLASIYRRERSFFDICIPGVRLRNNSSNVGPTSLIQILIREMGKRRQTIEKIGKRQELCKAEIVTTGIQQQSHCTPFLRSEAKVQGESSSSMAGLRQQEGAGTKKEWQGKSRRKQQVSGSRPRGESVSMQAQALEASDIRHLFFFSMQASHHEESVVRNLISWL